MRDEHQTAVGARIARLREQQGWSQRALAKWVDLDQSAVSRIEAGRRRLSAEELQRFAEAFRVTADVLLKGQGGDHRALIDDAPLLSRSPMLSPSPASRLSVPGEPDAQDSIDEATAAGVWHERRAPRPARVRGPREALSHQARMMPSIEDGIAAPWSDAALKSRSAPRPGAADDLAAAPQRRPILPLLGGLPEEAAGVVRDWFDLRRFAGAAQPEQRWSVGHSAEGKPERLARAAPGVPAAVAGDVLYDGVARFWRSELHVAPDDGPLPDLVPLLEDGYGVQVIVARTATDSASGASGGDSADRPVAASFSVTGVPFIFVNAARPVVLQRFALVHAFAHHALGHGDVVDRRIEWSRKVPPEAAANDFTEEFLAPVRAVGSWYEQRDVPRLVRLQDLLELANAFGISAWSALYRSRAAGRLQGKQFHALRAELQGIERELLPRQAYLGGVRDTLAHLTPEEALPRGAYGAPAVLRVPAAMHAWALAALEGGRLSVEHAAAFLRLPAGTLAERLSRMGVE